ncbi:MAG: hypothetical protein ACOY31_02180 [Bacillota bacterium]
MVKAADALLPPRARRLLGIHAFFLAGLNLSNIFFNVYLWKIHRSIELATVFNFFQFLTVPVVFFLGSFLVKRWGSPGNLRLGLFIHAVFYLMVLVLKDHVADRVILLGMLMGMGQGFYYLGYNVSTYDWTNSRNRDHFSGLNGAAAALASMAAPLAGGLIIACLGPGPGYNLVFAASVACFALAWAASLNFAGGRAEQGARFGQALKLAGPDWRRVSWSMALRGLREGVMSFALILLVYEITCDEVQLGYFNLVTSLATLLVFYLAGKLNSRDRHYCSMVRGSVLLFISTSVLLRRDLLALWVFGLANSIFYPFVFVPVTTISYNTIGNTARAGDYRMEFLTFREVPLNLGRLAGIALLLIFVREDWPVAWLIWALGLSQIPIGFILKPVKH